MTNSSPWYRWTIEIDGLPIKNGGSFHSYVSLPEGNLYNQHLEISKKVYNQTSISPTI